eukprot:gene12351-8479_t
MKVKQPPPLAFCGPLVLAYRTSILNPSILPLPFDRAGPCDGPAAAPLRGTDALLAELLRAVQETQAALRQLAQQQHEQLAATNKHLAALVGMDQRSQEERGLLHSRLGRQDATQLLRAVQETQAALRQLAQQQHEQLAATNKHLAALVGMDQRSQEERGLLHSRLGRQDATQLLRAVQETQAALRQLAQQQHEQLAATNKHLAALVGMDQRSQEERGLLHSRLGRQDATQLLRAVQETQAALRQLAQQQHEQLAATNKHLAALVGMDQRSQEERGLLHSRLGRQDATQLLRAVQETQAALRQLAQQQHEQLAATNKHLAALVGMDQRSQEERGLLHSRLGRQDATQQLAATNKHLAALVGMDQRSQEERGLLHSRLGRSLMRGNRRTTTWVWVWVSSKSAGEVRCLLYLPCSRIEQHLNDKVDWAAWTAPPVPIS